jgi:hypothetical protein
MRVSRIVRFCVDAGARMGDRIARRLVGTQLLRG